MTLARTTQQPLAVPAAQKRELRTQFGALCYRLRKDKVQVLLVTSRDTGRWIVPKGWPVDGQTPAQAAEVEAYEEAGVQGRTIPICIGLYSYTKDHQGDRLPCIVAMYPIHVTRLLDDFPESGERKRKWVSRKKAAKMVDNHELSQIISQFNPRNLRV